MAPVSWNGSHILYSKIIRPWFLKHEQEIDRDLSVIESGVNEAANAAVTAAKSQGNVKII